MKGWIQLYILGVYSKNYLWNTNRLHGSREPQTLLVYPNDSRLSILAMQKLQQLFIYVFRSSTLLSMLEAGEKGGAYCLQVRWKFSCVLKMAPAYNHLETNIIQCSQPQRNWSYRTNLLSTSLGVFIQFFSAQKFGRKFPPSPSVLQVFFFVCGFCMSYAIFECNCFSLTRSLRLYNNA